MRIWRDVRNFASQKFRLTPEIQPPTLLQNVLSVFINQRCSECVCLYYGLRVCGKNTLLLSVTVCEKVVPRLNKHDDVIEWNFMKIVPPEMKSWWRPCPRVNERRGVNEFSVPNFFCPLTTCFCPCFCPQNVSAIVNKMANFKRSNYAPLIVSNLSLQQTVLWCK